MEGKGPLTSIADPALLCQVQGNLDTSEALRKLHRDLSGSGPPEGRSLSHLSIFGCYDYGSAPVIVRVTQEPLGHLPLPREWVPFVPVCPELSVPPSVGGSSILPQG